VEAERRYTDREFAQIVRRAFALERQAPQSISARDGLTLDEMQAIAAEVGIDPVALGHAAALQPVERSGSMARALGAPDAWVWKFSIEGGGVDVSARLLGTMQRMLRQRGEIRRRDGMTEWRSVGRSDQVSVTMAPDGGDTRIEVAGDRGSALFLVALLALLPWSAAAAFLGAALSFTGSAVVLTVAALAGAFLTARLLWRATGRRLRDRLERLTGELRSEAMRLPAGRDDGTVG